MILMMVMGDEQSDGMVVMMKMIIVMVRVAVMVIVTGMVAVVTDDNGYWL